MSIRAGMSAIAWCALLTCAEAQQSLWNHNGSQMRLEAQGNARRFIYVNPRPGIPARPGDIVFEGQRNGSAYSGTAYVFSSRCGPASYRVSGRVENGDTSVVMFGRAPRRDSSCNIIGHVDDQLVFDLIASGTAPATRPTSGELDEQRALDAAIAILKGDPYGATPLQVARNIVSQTLGADRHCNSGQRAWTFNVKVAPDANNPNGISGYLVIRATSGKMICAGLPYLD